MNLQKMMFASAVVLMSALAACFGGSHNSSATYTLTQSQFNTLLAASPYTKAIADATAEQAQQATQLSKLQLIGKVKGSANEEHGQFRTSAVSTVSFGPCTDMGIYQGQGGSDSANPLQSQFEIYKQTADAQTGCPGSITSYNETTGLHDRLPFAGWDGPNCTGTMYVMTDTPQDTMSLSALEGILVMMSPDPSDNSVYSSTAGSTPQSVQIQSSMNGAPTAQICQASVSIHMAIAMTKNSTQVSGVPNFLVPGSWSRVSP